MGSGGLLEAGLADTDIRRIFRSALGGAIGLAVVGLGVCTALGHPLIGVGVAAGLALGALNAWGIRGMASRIADAGGGKRPAVVSSLRRLGLITVAVFGLVLLDRDTGFAAVGGLAAFQLLLLVCCSRVLLRILSAEGQT
jgi:hypothetical protein